MRTSFDAMLAAISGRKWRVTELGSIRCGENTCPLVAAGLDLNEYEFRKRGGAAGSVHYKEGADVIGYGGDIDCVLDAADFPLHDLRGRGRTLRRKMLDAFGLTEEE